MSATKPTGTLALARLRLSGVAFLLVLLGLIGLTVAIYNKAFTPVVTVVLEADRAGNQLSSTADVKVRGLIVGEVRDVSSTGSGARIELALQPDKVGLIPENVQARLLPKTLFGEKFVDLVLPSDPAQDHLREGDVIPQDRSETARETAKAVDDLLPLLQTLKPQQLSFTLNALSGALRGRGDQIGANLERVDAYLKQFNPELPALEQDFRGLADLADNLDRTAPDLLAVLDNFSFSSRALVDQSDELRDFLTTTSGFSASLDSLLKDNEDRLVVLARDSLPSLQVYAKYAPEFACLAGGLVAFTPRVQNSFGQLQRGLHITLEVTEDQNGYLPGDEPQNLDDRGPRCYGLPVPEGQAPDQEFRDGYRDEERAGIGDGTQTSQARTAADPVRSLLGPASQRQLLDAVAAPVMGVPVAEVPDLVELLFGPVARGTTVGLA